ncbi:DUF4861 family protein [Pseudozobellia thermophila]|uniref:DUF4861 domain-containing protein n=1 Tax=Pseudozobellia thermophila TaxID=192903 RepID=A0A1M6CCY5_9FLAO|nr:DUF4861 family protein [Pseudozobellia thermophila]SHI58568.1 protein of unknown function [Pseudozobellia thermophila]
MVVNKTIFLAGVLIWSMSSCKQNTKEGTAEAIAEKEVVAPKTYAEISIKEGGQWVGTKYVGENFTFKNVDYLKAPDSLTDHSYYVRYEGPGWESNKVGYRIYFDWRNAIDIFGKKVDTMVLSKVGQDNYDSYHEDSPWGMDILKAGSSLGIGSYGRFDGKNTVEHFKQVRSRDVRIHNSDKGSGVVINYLGWTALDKTIDLKSELFIEPDSRMTKATLTPSQAGEGLCTGMVKFDGIDLMTKKSEDGQWGYMATYGEQSLVPDNLGMVIFYKTETVDQMVDSEHDHLLVFKPTAEPITYYFAAAWEQEKDGLKSKEEFIAYIDGRLQELAR